MNPDNNYNSLDFENYIRKVYKVIMIGNSGVGKTSIITRFVHDRFLEKEGHTIGVSYLTKTLCDSKNKVIHKLCLWDTAGQERFYSIVKMYFKKCQGIICVYDITDIKSLIDCDMWLREVRTHLEESNDTVPIILIGNKLDLIDSRKKEIGGNNTIPETECKMKEMIMQYEADYNIKHFCTDAKYGTGITEAFHFIMNCMTPHCIYNKDFHYVAEKEQEKSQCKCY